MRIFGIDPGASRTGYGCVERLRGRHRLVACGALAGPASASFPDRLRIIHQGLLALLATHHPDCVVVENIFHARNARSALTLGHASEKVTKEHYATAEAVAKGKQSRVLEVLQGGRR